MQNKQKQCIVYCAEFIGCGFLTVIFLVLASLSLIFGEWLVAILSYILCVLSGYYAIKGIWHYFDITHDSDEL